jgi:hypothetical protein
MRIYGAHPCKQYKFIVNIYVGFPSTRKLINLRDPRVLDSFTCTLTVGTTSLTAERGSDPLSREHAGRNVEATKKIRRSTTAHSIRRTPPPRGQY